MLKLIKKPLSLPLLLNNSQRIQQQQQMTASRFEKVENFEQTARAFFNFQEIDKDCFSPAILKNARQGHHSAAYGGLVFAQALAAAEMTVDEKFKPHSIHSYFIMNVDTKVPLKYHVKRVRDGRSFVTRTVEAIQNEKIVFVFQASFHVEEKESIIHQLKMPKVPDPEELMSMREAVPWMKEKIEKGEIKPPPALINRLKNYDAVIYSDDADLFEMRSTNLGHYYGFDSKKHPSLSFWMRARGDIGDDQRLHRYLLAYNSDSLLVSAAVTPHYSAGFISSMLFSLDHSVWFHKPNIRVDEWLLFECNSNVAAGSRSFVDGKIWKKDGTLLASCHQEALIRSNDNISKI